MHMSHALPAALRRGLARCPCAHWAEDLRWSVAHACGGSGPTCPRLTSEPACSCLPRALSHRQTPHETPPAAPSQDVPLPAALVTVVTQRHHCHRSNSRWYGAEALAAQWEEETGAACQATVHRATRVQPLTSATVELGNAPQAGGCAEHASARACDVQHSAEHCVAA